MEHSVICPSLDKAGSADPVDAGQLQRRPRLSWVLDS
jgi:hypothetical protein